MSSFFYTFKNRFPSAFLRSIEERIGLSFLVAALLLAFAPASHAHEFKAGSLEIHHPWARATPAGARVGGGYVTIRNHGGEADKLVAVSSEIADRVEIHEMGVKDGVMRMRKLEDGLALPAGAETVLKPGSYHIMFIGLKQPLKEGESFAGSLRFEKSGSVDVSFKVESIAAGAEKQGEATKGHGAH